MAELYASSPPGAPSRAIAQTPETARRGAQRHRARRPTRFRRQADAVTLAPRLSLVLAGYAEAVATVYGWEVVVAVFGDAHAHAEALDAVLGAAEEFGVDELWSLGDMIGRGPDPKHVVARTRESCAVALMGNHDYGATGAAEPTRFGEPGSPAARSIELARERLSDADLQWMRSRRPAARRGEVQCWHGGPRNAVHEYVGASNAGACLAVQRAAVGLVGHTHAAAAWRQTPRGARAVRIRVGAALDLTGGKWLLNPGAVGAPTPPQRGWWDALEREAAVGAFWMRLDLKRHTATWYRAPFDPAPARLRARALGLDDAAPPVAVDADR